LTNEEKEVLDEFHDEMQSLAKIHNEGKKFCDKELIRKKRLKNHSDKSLTTEIKLLKKSIGNLKNSL